MAGHQCEHGEDFGRIERWLDNHEKDIKELKDNVYNGRDGIKRRVDILSDWKDNVTSMEAEAKADARIVAQQQARQTFQMKVLIVGHAIGFVLTIMTFIFVESIRSALGF